MRQIVMNLLINAAEAIGEDGGTILVRTANVLADREMLAGMTSDLKMVEGSYAMLEVADTGGGIDAERRARIFEPFFSTKSTGRGLGLAAVMGIVRGHRGTIRIQSEPGQGTVFQVLLPSCDSPVAPRQEPVPPLPSPVGGTILVVDDEQAIRTVAQAILEDSGFSVLLAQDGKEGVEVFRQHAEHIQAVLLDMTMPYMDGRAVLNAIRYICPDARVLLSSGYGEQQTAGDLICDRNTQFIQKPYRADQLLAKLQQILAC
jgi:CheY-like chemotaxis protein